MTRPCEKPQARRNIARNISFGSRANCFGYGLDGRRFTWQRGTLKAAFNFRPEKAFRSLALSAIDA